ncbi:uncharacterized protein [Neodiprion pinetum]|uniref:uncharacterized protein n=1 Tax=Neodiprion pinetum TaxID=441929 RepID=UPI0037234CA1
MPARRRGASIARHTPRSASRRNTRALRTEDQIQQDNTHVRENMARLRQAESEDVRAERNERRRLEQRQSRRLIVGRCRANEQQRQQVHRLFTSNSFLRLAFEYEHDIQYYAHSKVVIGAMDKECPHCHALKFKTEPPGMCCSSGKVQLPAIETPPEPLNGLLIGTDPDSNLFLKSIRTFNSCFQMTSFGATEIIRNNAINGQQFNSTFKIKGQIYHKVGSLLPMPNGSPKFLQIYFMGGEDARVDARCGYNNLDSFFARRIVSDLDSLLNEHNELLKIFKSHMHKLQSDNHAIVINPDKTPAGEHIRRFNAPVLDDVAGIMVGDRTAKREIVIRRRNNNLQFIADTHRSYDALQYPLMFWKGQDGYCINIKQRNPATGAETNKNVSSKDYYAYRLMIRRDQDNVILRCRELCQQFMVDMYVKIESERLRYLRFNQEKLRAEEYIHLRDAIVNNADAAQIANMIHGPCGNLNPYIALHGRWKIVEIDIDNRWVVPYSPLLSKTFNAHINVEFCSSVKSIKYICKYVNKGSDMAVFRVDNINANAPPVNTNDEITLYQIGRYVSSNEAGWRIFGFPIHERDPAVIHLAVHLENGQRVYFTTETAIDRAINPPKTTLTEFFELCNRADVFGAFARTLLYSEIPRYFTWAPTKKWMPRKQGTPIDGYPGLFKSNTLGQVFTVNPRQTECFYLRLLLVNVIGPLSFQDIRKVDGQQYPTYKDACHALGLLEDDNQWECMLAEAGLNCAAKQIRLLFAIVLTTCFPTRAETLWDNHKDLMTDDILHQHRTRCNDLTIVFSDAMYNEALIAIEDLCITIANLPLSHFGMHSPNRNASDLMNTELNRELQYNTAEMAAIVARNVPLMNEEQKTIYDRIMLAVSAGQGGFFFLDAPGGTGKTFLISLILAEIRSNNGIALAVASSGIAATLLDGGRTAHSVFKLPLNIQNNPDAVCNIKKQSSMATVLKRCKIIIWDECTMAHKHSLEALNRSLKDIKNNDKLFGGTLLLLSGDFRQTLPVIPRSTYADEINACLKSSPLWRNVEKVQLKVNMRVQMLQDPSAETFSKQLLDIGDGKVARDESGCIKLQADFCTVIDSQDALIDQIFPDVRRQYANHGWLAERAILAAKNVDVNELNLKIQHLLPGELVSYKSIDTVCDDTEAVNFPTEFLNSLDLPGMPPHNLQLKASKRPDTYGIEIKVVTDRLLSSTQEEQKDQEIIRALKSHFRKNLVLKIIQCLDGGEASSAEIEDCTITSDADNVGEEDDVPLNVWTRAIDNQLPITNEDFEQYACIDDAVATSEEPSDENIVQNIIANDANNQNDGDDDEPEETYSTLSASEAVKAAETFDVCSN